MLQPLMTLPFRSTVLHDQQMEFVTYVRRVTKCTGKMDTPPRPGIGNSRIGDAIVRSTCLRREYITGGQRIFASGSC